MCNFSNGRVVAVWLHWEHLKVRSSTLLWVSRWAFKLHLTENPLPQNWQLKGFSLVWTRSCCWIWKKNVKYNLAGDYTWAGNRKLLEQNLQLNFFSIPVSTGSWQLDKCAVKFPTVLNLWKFTKVLKCTSWICTWEHRGGIGSVSLHCGLMCELIAEICSWTL